MGGSENFKTTVLIRIAKKSQKITFDLVDVFWLMFPQMFLFFIFPEGVIVVVLQRDTNGTQRVRVYVNHIIALLMSATERVSQLNVKTALTVATQGAPSESETCRLSENH